MFTDKIVLITTLYEGCIKENIRYNEFKQCFDINVLHSQVERLVYFFEPLKRNSKELPINFQYLKHPKVEIVFINDIPSFKILFKYANSHYPDNYIVVHNADIYYKESSKLEYIKRISNHETLWFLHRYQYNSILKRFLLSGHFVDKLGYSDTQKNPINQTSTSDEIPTYPDDISMSLFEENAIQEIKAKGLLPEPYGFPRIKEIIYNIYLSHRELKDWVSLLYLIRSSIAGIIKKRRGYYNFDDTKLFGCVDSWCFYSPLSSINFDYPIGRVPADRLIMLDAKQQKITCANPSLTIISYHLHSYKTRVKGYNRRKKYRKIKNWVSVPVTALGHIEKPQRDGGLGEGT